MGVKKLIKKTELNYRKGYTHADCSGCDHFVSIFGPGESRCKIMGLVDGRLYRINPNHICDAHDNTINIRRLRGPGWG